MIEDLPPGHQRGAQTRQVIVAGAVDLASTIGLEGLTLGTLADRLGLSKSGLYAHFGSKEELQLATLLRAREIFVTEVIRPALAEPRGLLRLWGLAVSFLFYLERPVFPGGCFISAAIAEFDARPGAVHDAVTQAMVDWRATTVRMAQDAVAAGHLSRRADVTQLAFELCALLQGTNFQYQLQRDHTLLERGARAVHDRLTNLATRKAPELPPWQRERSDHGD